MRKLRWVLFIIIFYPRVGWPLQSVTGYTTPITDISLLEQDLINLRKIAPFSQSTPKIIAQFSQLFPDVYFILVEPWGRSQELTSWRDPKISDSELKYYQSFFESNPGQDGELLSPNKKVVGHEDRPLSTLYVVLVNSSSSPSVVVHEVPHLLIRRADSSGSLLMRESAGHGLDPQLVRDINNKMALRENIEPQYIDIYTRFFDSIIEFSVADLGEEVEADYFILQNSNFFNLEAPSIANTARYFTSNLDRFEAKLESATEKLKTLLKYTGTSSSFLMETLGKFAQYKGECERLRLFVEDKVTR